MSNDCLPARKLRKWPMRNNESTLPGIMFFPDDDTPVLGFGCL